MKAAARRSLTAAAAGTPGQVRPFRLIAVLLHSSNPYRDARRLLTMGFALRR